MVSPCSIVGFILEILGAGVLAFPDIPSVRRLFSFGRLQFARQLLDSEGVRETDSGFDELRRALSDLEPVAPADDPSKEPTLIQISDSPPGTAASLPTGMQTDREYVVVKRGVDLAHYMDFYELGPVYRKIRSEIKPSILYFRIIGFLLLILGSLLLIIPC